MLSELGADPIRGSLSDDAALREGCSGVDAVFHLAGGVRGKGRVTPDVLNRQGTERLLNAGAEDIVFVSSCAVYGDRSNLWVEEDFEASPNTRYGRSKAEAEALVRESGRRHTIVRLAAVYGPGDRATLAIFRQWRAGFMVVPSNGEQRVSLIHAGDLAAGVAALLASGRSSGETFEIGDRHPDGYGWDHMAKAGGLALGRAVSRIAVPRAILMAGATVNLAAHGLIGRTPVVTPGKIRELCHPDWVCDDGPMAAASGWSPTMSINDGFKDTVAWYRNHGWL